MPPTKTSKLPSARNAQKIAAGATGATCALILALLVLAPHFAAAKEQKQKGQDPVLAGLPETSLSESDAIVHALNRLGYGPRPGDVQGIQQMGLAKWIDQQLRPESISDAAVDARLGMFPTLTMSSTKLIEEFPRPQQAAKREGVTVEEYRKQQQEKLANVREQASADQNAVPAAQGNGQGADQPGAVSLGAANANPGGALANYEQIKAPQRVVAELSMAKLERAIYSERQLERANGGFLVQSLQCLCGEGRRRLAADLIRARRHTP